MLYRTLALAFVLAAAAVWQPAHAQLGVAAGLNFDDYGDIDTGSAQATFDASTGWHVGVFYDLAVGPVAVRPGLFYRDAGTLTFETEGPGPSLQDQFDLQMIEIPLDVRLRLAALPIVRPYAVAGPVLTFPTSSDDSFSAVTKDFVVSADVGLGAELSLPGMGLTFYPELRYAFGVSRFFEEGQLGNFTFRGDDADRQNSFMLRLGIGF